MFTSEKEIEVRYAETDQMGVVYHANYLVWMEIGRTTLIEDLGYEYAQLEARRLPIACNRAVNASIRRRLHMVRLLRQNMGRVARQATYGLRL